MDRNEWFRREKEIEEALETRVDELFGEDFLYRIDSMAEKVIKIELEEYLDLKDPGKEDLGERIAYLRAYRRLKRFRKEESFRLLLEANWSLARSNVDGDPAEEDLMYSAQMLKNSLIDLDEFEIRKGLDKKYNGEEK